MKILVVTPLLPPESGGPSYYAVGLADALKRAGHEVDTVAFREVRQYPSGIRHLMFLYLVLGKGLRADAFMILDTVSVALPAVLAGWLLFKKMVIRTGGDFVWEAYVERTKEKVLLSEFYRKPYALSRKERVLVWLQKHVIFPLTHTVVFNTAWQRDVWRTPYGIPDEKTAVIENEYKPRTGEHRGGGPYLAAWRPTAFKNIDTLEVAYEKAREQCPGVELEVYKDIPRDELHEKMRTARALVIPSLTELGPNMAMEALALGLPVILTKDCGVRERLGDAVTWIDPRSPDSIAQASIRTLMKRILIFSLSYLPKHVGGAEVALKEITDRIPREDIEFHMVCLRYDSALPAVEQLGNVLVHRIGFTRTNPSMADLSRWPLHFNKYLYQFYAAWVAHKLHKTHHYDGIWAMMAHSAGVPAALFKVIHPGVAYVQTLQEGDPPLEVERMARPVWPLFTRAFTTPTVIQAISKYLADWARRRGATCPVEVIPNGVDTARFVQAPEHDALTAVQARLGKRDGDVWLVTTSRLVRKNAVDVVLRALPGLPAHVKFAIAGTGPEESALKRLAEELGVSSRVVFCGEVQHKEVPAYLHACDIFIRPSRSEGMGNSFIEAMATGVPVIGTHEGGIPDFLVDAHAGMGAPTGWVVQKDTPEDIARAVREVLENPDKVREVVSNARDLAMRAYDWNLIAREMQTRVFSHIPEPR